MINQLKLLKVFKLQKTRMSTIMKEKIFTEAVTLTPHSWTQLYLKGTTMILENRICWGICKKRKETKKIKTMALFMKCRWLWDRLLKKEQVYLICYIQEKMMHRMNLCSRLTNYGRTQRRNPIKIMFKNKLKTQVYNRIFRLLHHQRKIIVMLICLIEMMIDSSLISNLL